VLGPRVVDGDDGVSERSILGHRPQADHAGGGLLGPADELLHLFGALPVQRRDQVGAVVHRQMRLVIEDRADVGVVGLLVLAPDRIGVDAEGLA
jgi:hypothetical protein